MKQAIPCLCSVVMIYHSFTTPVHSQAITPIICSVDSRPMVTSNKIAGIAANAKILENKEQVETFSTLLKEADIRKATRSLRWDRIESTKGIYQWNYVGNGEGLHDSATTTLPANTIIFKPGLTPKWASPNPTAWNFNSYPPINITDWKNFVTAAAKRYGHGSGGSGKVKDWEIWNEPNITEYFNGSAQQFLELNNIAYDAIKSVDSNATVWSPGIVVWSDTLVGTPNGSLRVPQSGEIKYLQHQKLWDIFYLLIEQGKFDGFSYHVYGNNTQIFKVTQALKQKLAAYPAHAHKKFMLSETNLSVGIPWENCPYDTISETQQKTILQQRYACSFNAGADIVLWFPIRDRINLNCSNGNLNDGIIRQDYSKKPSYQGLKDITEIIASANSCTGIACHHGDFNSDRKIDFLDYQLIIRNFTQTTIFNLSNILNQFNTLY